MTARDIVYTAAGTLRAPWRLLLFALALFAAMLVLMATLGMVFGVVFELLGLRGQTFQSIFQMLGALLATWICLFIEKKSWREVGLHAEAAAPAKLGAGILVGSGAITLAIVALIAAGWLDRLSGTTSDWGGPLLRITLVLLPAAFFEELVARGYAMTALRDALGWKWAVAITSIFFGVMHMQNPGADAQSVIIVALAGVFLAAVRIGTDSLYAATAAHFAWNWVMAALFHTPVSGYAFEYPAYRYVDAGPDWATGGGWGPESGIPAGVMMILGTLVILKRAALKDLLLRRKVDG